MKACPFCHGVMSRVLDKKDSGHVFGFQTECMRCGARGPAFLATPRDALKAWDVGLQRENKAA